MSHEKSSLLPYVGKLESKRKRVMVDSTFLKMQTHVVIVISTFKDESYLYL